VGGFCSLYNLGSMILAASTDGVGTKSILAKEFKKNGYLETIGFDLIGMVMNDVITSGATPLFFLDYLGITSLNKNIDKYSLIIQGISEACSSIKCAFIGGETAEMSDIYVNNLFDLAGFGVGIVSPDSLKGKHLVTNNDVVIGIKSSGPHSNGYSLIRKIFSIDYLWGNFNTLNSIMKPTVLYANTVKTAIDNFSSNIHSMAHITGGGLEYNTLRVIPEGLKLNIDWTAWNRPQIFNHIQEKGRISEDEMRKVFNCGIGYVFIVDKSIAEDFITQIPQSLIIGNISNDN
jgi:phosphoribosylformylglycinamidine cyclo-ligase